MTQVLFNTVGQIGVGTLGLLAQIDKAPPVSWKWVPAAIAVIMVLCIILASVMSSKRSHRD